MAKTTGLWARRVRSDGEEVASIQVVDGLGLTVDRVDVDPILVDEVIAAGPWYRLANGTYQRSRDKALLHRWLLDVSDRGTDVRFVNGNRRDHRLANLEALSRSERIARDDHPAHRPASGVRHVAIDHHGRAVVHVKKGGRVHYDRADTIEEATARAAALRDRLGIA